MADRLGNLPRWQGISRSIRPFWQDLVNARENAIFAFRPHFVVRFRQKCANNGPIAFSVASYLKPINTGMRITARNLPKSNWDCTIRASYRWDVSGFAGLNTRENRVKLRAFGGGSIIRFAGVRMRVRHVHHSHRKTARVHGRVFR